MTPIIQLLRPKQWIKNGFVIAPIFFSARFMDTGSWGVILQAALAFIAASIVVYVVNDIRDVKEDRLHPVKSLRPLAAQTVTMAQAWLCAVLSALACVGLLSNLPLSCAFIIGLYTGLNILYTWALKRLALLDVLFIASCYVMRVLMGCFALSVVVSPWIILASFMVALFLGFGKRYQEMSLANYVSNKPNLQQYSRELLDKLLVICAGASLMTYAIYAASIAEHTGRNDMIYTVGFVAFGLFRYLQSVYVYGQGGEPESVIIKDKWQWINMALWLLAVMFILGAKNQLI